MTKPEIAVALRYAWGDGPPVVAAAGKGDLAGRIVDEALRHGVPVHADATLAQLLAKAPVGTAIPAEAFLAVAELLAFLIHVDRSVAASVDPEPRPHGGGAAAPPGRSARLPPDRP